MIAYYVYGTLRFKQVIEKRLVGKADLTQLKISYKKASLENFLRLVGAMHEGSNASFPVKGQKIDGQKVETVVAEAGKFEVPEGELLLIDGPALELIKVLPPLDRYEQSYVKVEIPVENSEEIKRAYVYIPTPWRVTPSNLEKLPKPLQKILNSLTSYYELSRMQTEEVQKVLREAYESEIKKVKAKIILCDSG